MVEKRSYWGLIKKVFIFEFLILPCNGEEMMMILLYIDPGTGSLLIQLLIASLLGAFAFFGRIRQFFTRIFQNIFRKDKKNDV